MMKNQSKTIPTPKALIVEPAQSSLAEKFGERSEQTSQEFGANAKPNGKLAS